MISDIDIRAAVLISDIDIRAAVLISDRSDRCYKIEIIRKIRNNNETRVTTVNVHVIDSDSVITSDQKLNSAQDQIELQINKNS